MTTRTQYVLIDFENVQPIDIELIKTETFEVKIFLGAHQSKIPIAIAIALQHLGVRAEYITLETTGKNALDFHIAYYIGVLATANPSAYFHIISKDTGFDPLLHHLKNKQIKAQRSCCIADIPCLKPIPTNLNEQVTALAQQLSDRKVGRPKTQKTLLNSMNSFFKKELSEPQLAAILAGLCKKGFIKIEGEKLIYNFPEATLQPA